jgi:hypothetical protein
LKESVAKFAGPYRELLNIILQSKVKEHAQIKKARADYLTAQASVAAFLAAVQIGFIAFTAGVHDNPTSTVQRVIDIFSFCAVSFDALGALSALTTAQSLLQVYFKSDQCMQYKSHIEGRMHKVLSDLEQALGVGVEGEPSPTIGLHKEIEEKLNNVKKDVEKNFVQVGRLNHILENHAVGSNEALLIIILGVICFFVSLITFIINNQPKAVWVPTIVAVAITTSIVLRNENRSQMGRWNSMVSGFRKWFGWMNIWRSGGGKHAETRDDAEMLDDEDQTRRGPVSMGTTVTMV